MDILRYIEQKDECIVQIKDFQRIREFKTGKVRSGLESLALVMSGHQPIVDYHYDFEKVKEWVESIGKDVLLNEYEGLAYFKKL